MVNLPRREVGGFFASSGIGNNSDFGRKAPPMPKQQPWTRDDLLLAMNLYCRLPLPLSETACDARLSAA